MREGCRSHNGLMRIMPPPFAVTNHCRGTTSSVSVNVLADLGQLGAATARARSRHRMNDTPTRQIGGKVAPRCRAPREACTWTRSASAFVSSSPLPRPVPRVAIPVDRSAAGSARSTDRISRAASWRSPIADARSPLAHRKAWRASRSAPPSMHPYLREGDQRPRQRLRHQHNPR
jgi:hypothetical protein